MHFYGFPNTFPWFLKLERNIWLWSTVLTKSVFQIRYHAFLHELTCYGSCTLMCHTGQFNEHIRLFETLYRGKLKGYHCNWWLYTCIYMYIHVYTLQICCIKSYTNFYLVLWHLTPIKWHHGIICELSFKVAFYVGYGPYCKLWLFQQWQRHRHVKSANNFQVPWHIFLLHIMFTVNMYYILRFEIFVAVQFINCRLWNIRIS